MNERHKAFLLAIAATQVPLSGSNAVQMTGFNPQFNCRCADVVAKNCRHSDCPRKQNSQPIPTTAAPPKHSAIEHTLAIIFEKAGVKLGRNPVFSVSRSQKGWMVTIQASSTNLHFKKIMRLRAYLTHYFQVKNFSIAPTKTVANGIGIKYSLTVKAIKKDKDGVHRLVERNAVPKKKEKPKGRIVKHTLKAKAAFQRIRAHAALIGFIPGD